VSLCFLLEVGVVAFVFPIFMAFLVNESLLFSASSVDCSSVKSCYVSHTKR